MTATILITGFGPFPGAPFNPTGPLIMELAQRRHPAFANARRLAHVFPVSYEAVDRELPALLTAAEPDALIMFGLAGRANHVRVETRARNARSRLMPDVGGEVPLTTTIAPGAPATMPLRTPVRRLVLAARAVGVPAAPSHDAGRYLCNYLCWRAAEAVRSGRPRLIAFVHVPPLHRAGIRSRASPMTLDDLAQAGEAILRAALAACRPPSGASNPACF
ncbi:MAG: pyroglutamyl-peptidase I [Xanthobacteraceae bacterium]